MRQVISLPSQNCTYKVKITETSVVVKADIISFRGKSTVMLCSSYYISPIKSSLWTDINYIRLLTCLPAISIVFVSANKCYNSLYSVIFIVDRAIKAWNSLPQSRNFSSLAAFKRSILRTDLSKHLTMLFVWCREFCYLLRICLKCLTVYCINSIIFLFFYFYV